VVQRALIVKIQSSNPPFVVLEDGAQLDAVKARLKTLDSDE